MSKLTNMLVLMLALFCVMASCDKEEPLTEQQKKTNMLTSKPWNITNVAVTGTNTYSYTSGASTIKFNQDGTYAVTGAASLPENRNPYGAFPAAGNWAFASPTNFNTIVLTAGANTTNLTVTTLSDNSLIFSYDAALGKAANEVSATVTAQPKQ